LKILILTVFSVLIFTSVLKSQYTSPESVTFDSVGNRYLVSNTSGGVIRQRSANGTVTDFVTVGGSTHGLTVHNNKVYICNGTRVKGYNLTNANEIFNVQLTGSSFLNDIAIDNSGIAYVTDFSTQRIYKVNTNTQAWWIYVPATGRTPNGIYVDTPRNRLLVCCWGASPNVIKSVNLTDSTVTNIANLNYGNCDGITLDKYDNVYVSSWSPQRVVRFDIGFTIPVFEVVSSGLSNPADIYINKTADTLAVPNAGNNTVTFYNIGNISGITMINHSVPDDFSLSQNYPNPFNPVTKIRFHIPAGKEFAIIKIYDAAGKEVSTLVNEQLSAGIYEVNFDASAYSSGVYYYKLVSGVFSKVKKMVLVK
jgi:streptogramin lyase